jgi:hypothetical protein
MPENTKHRLIALALAGALFLPVCPAYAQAPAQPGAEKPPAEGEAPDVQPKFIWGVLIIKYIAGEVLSTFAQWSYSKITGKPVENRTMLASAVDYLRGKSDTSGGAYIQRGVADGPAGLKETPQIAIERPSTPITVEGGSPNYQGVHIAIVGIDGKGEITELRSVKAGFRTGERFKLRAISTFGGQLVIENINPKGERKQIYPGERNAVIVLQPGADTLLPLGANEFFEFARTTGEEQLVISLRDPRAVGNAASRQKVYRKDEEFGSHFVQETSKDAYPVISETIRLEHR